MKISKLLSVALLSAVSAFAVPVNVQKTDSMTNHITGDVTFGIGRTLKIEPGATIDATGAIILGFGGGGSLAWGSLVGTLSNQTDLQAALNAKQSTLTFTQSLSNSAGTVTLTNDSASPGASTYYGTNSGGTKGYFSLPAAGGVTRIIAGANVTISPPGGTGNVTINSSGGGGGGGGTMTSFSAGALSPLFTTGVANPTTDAVLSFTLSTQSANLFFAGPTSGGATGPTFRAIASGDLPQINLASTAAGGVTGTLPVANGGTASNTVASAVATLTPASQFISGTSIDWATGTSFYKTLSTNTTFSFANASDGLSISVILTNTSGNWGVTWPTVSWPNGIVPAMTVGVHTDIYTFIVRGSTIYGSYIQNY